MKHTQVKDALRNIWKQKVSWFAIVIIAMLSVMAYLGINFASRGIAGNGNTFYDETRFRDAEIVSTLLVTPDDMDALLAVEGVSDAEGVYQTSGKIEAGGARANVDVVSLTDRINTPLLLEGRLPETGSECAAEQPVMESLGLSVGDTIRITDAHGDCASYLVRTDFVITGVVFHPDHAAQPDHVPGNRDIVVLPEAFDEEALGGCFMKAVLLFEGTAGLDRFGREYADAASAVLERLETLGADRALLRSGEVRTEYQSQIDEGHAELDNGREELESARAELDDGWAALADGEKELADGEKELAEGKQQLEDAWQELLDAKDRLEAAEAELAAARAELDSGRAELSSAQRRLDSAETELEKGWNELEAAKAGIRSGIRAAVESFVGDTTGLVAWASEADFRTDSSATAMELWITEGFKVDLNKSLEENLSDFINSGAIPYELLEEGYRSIAGGDE